jgi:hypothetical protein
MCCTKGSMTDLLLLQFEIPFPKWRRRRHTLNVTKGYRVRVGDYVAQRAACLAQRAA